MLRARRTAEVIARACRLPIQIEPELHERKVGDIAGNAGARATFGVWPDTLARWVAGETYYAPPGMESFDQMRDRVLPVWDRVTLENQGKSLVIVAHGIVCRVILLSVLDGYNAADWPRLGRIANVSISEIVGSGRTWRAVRIGHVPDEVRKEDEAEEMRSTGDIGGGDTPAQLLSISPRKPANSRRPSPRSSDEDAGSARPIPSSFAFAPPLELPRPETTR